MIDTTSLGLAIGSLVISILHVSYKIIRRIHRSSCIFRFNVDGNNNVDGDPNE